MRIATVEYLNGTEKEHLVIRGGDAAVYEKALELLKEPGVKRVLTTDKDGELDDILALGRNGKSQNDLV